MRPLCKKGFQASEILIVVAIGVAAIVLAAAMFHGQGNQGSNLFNLALTSVSEPERPDLTVSATCTSKLDSTGSTANIVERSTLRATIKNSGKAPVKSRIDVTITSPSQQQVQINPADVDRLKNGLPAGQSITFGVENAIPGTYLVEVDKNNNIIEESEVNNKDTDKCDGTSVVDCFVRLPSNTPSGTYYCKPDCRLDAAAAGSSCGGCKNPQVIGADDACKDSCGCVCPANSLVGYVQIASGKGCGGKLLPDLTSQIGSLVGSSVTVSVRNAGTATAGASTLCVTATDAKGTIKTSERSVPALSASGAPAAFTVTGVGSGSSVRIEADCKKVVEELDETNNVAAKTF